LYGTIEVLVIDRVFIVPDTIRWVRYLVTHKPDPVVPWIRFDLIYRRASPSHNGRVLSHGGTCFTKTKRLVNSEYAVLTVGCVVIHVALSRVTLAPGAFVGDDVIGFGEIGRPRV
jgi:hypothetical protein